jgi:DNA-binding NtrC family response regulator
LFGYKKGAFTGAHADRRGLFEIADGGTVFLDEIGELGLNTQTALLRVLDTGEFKPLGPETEYRKTDVRIVCATHRNLEQLVEQGRFRHDLFFRLKGTTIELPALRNRREDIPLLAERFRDAETIGKGKPFRVYAAEAMNALIEHDWPGNVRELKQAVESLIVLSDSELIVADDVHRYLRSKPPTDPTRARGLSDRLRELERTLIIQALAEADYSISEAAALLGLERSNLSKKIKSHGIDLATVRQSVEKTER